ncbi:hypothetical protein EX30DRAFT_194781 [Ascodesmis nigricans]|uniref:SET domain-containing protein n=1 Tax=Ascodesmis nigricans TaxID=341454 RepID=A0A4S2MKT9_9PEZI|nr:hypothetical protein EX30DRAFT_194781 [Ascodesmis nigricans]
MATTSTATSGTTSPVDAFGVSSPGSSVCSSSGPGSTTTFTGNTSASTLRLETAIDIDLPPRKPGGSTGSIVGAVMRPGMGSMSPISASLTVRLTTTTTTTSVTSDSNSDLSSPLPILSPVPRIDPHQNPRNTVSALTAALRPRLFASRTPSSSSATSNSPNLLYRIAPIPSRGLGLISTARIEPHVCIVNESPILRSSTDSYDEAFANASQSALQKFYLLPNKHLLWSIDRPDTLEEQLWDTNVVSDMEGRTAVFDVVNRVNHDCHPNAVLAMYADREHLMGDTSSITSPGEESNHSFSSYDDLESGEDGEIKRAKVVAKRIIEKGEEITVDYLMGEGDNKDVEWRRNRLAKDWGFWCMCPKCVLEAKFAERRKAWLRLMEKEQEEAERRREEEEEEERRRRELGEEVGPMGERR